MSRYASTSDLTRLGVPATALTGVTTATQEAALDAASALADGYLQERFTLPLAAWVDDLRRAVCCVAAYDILSARGFDPRGGGTDENVRLRYEDALRWLRDVGAGHATPTGVIDATPTVTEGGTYAVTNPSRRWRR